MQSKCPGIALVDRCPGSKNGVVPKLSRANYKFVSFFFKEILPWLPNGMGGFRIEAVKTVMDTYMIPKDKQPEILKKCTIMIDAYKEIYAIEHPSKK